MLTKHVYLCGAITSNPYTWEWRKAAEEWFDDRGMSTLNPLRGKMVQNIDGLGFNSNIPAKHFVPRDLSDVENCDAVLCNLLFIPDRQMIGSLMEIGAATALEVPFVVVAVHEHIVKHPFIYVNAIDIVPTLEEGMEIVRFLLM